MTIQNLLQASKKLNDGMEAVRKLGAELSGKENALKENLAKQVEVAHKIWVAGEEQKNSEAKDAAKEQRKTTLKTEQKNTETRLKNLRDDRAREVAEKDYSKKEEGLKNALERLQGLRAARKDLELETSKLQKLKQAEEENKQELADLIAREKKAFTEIRAAWGESNALKKHPTVQTLLNEIDIIYPPEAAPARSGGGGGGSASASASRPVVAASSSAMAPDSAADREIAYHRFIEVTLPAFIEKEAHEESVAQDKFEREKCDLENKIKAYDPLLAHLKDPQSAVPVKPSKQDLKSEEDLELAPLPASGLPAASKSSHSGEKDAKTEDVAQEKIAKLEQEKNGLKNEAKDLESAIGSLRTKQATAVFGLSFDVVKGALTECIKIDGELLSELKAEKEQLDGKLTDLQVPKAPVPVASSSSSSSSSSSTSQLELSAAVAVGVVSTASSSSSASSTNVATSSSSSSSAPSSTRPLASGAIGATPSADSKAVESIDSLQAKLKGIDDTFKKINEIRWELENLSHNDSDTYASVGVVEKKPEENQQQKLLDAPSLCGVGSRYTVSEKFMQLTFQALEVFLRCKYQPMYEAKLEDRLRKGESLKNDESAKNYAMCAFSVIAFGIHYDPNHQNLIKFLEWAWKHDPAQITVTMKVIEKAVSLQPEKVEALKAYVQGREDQFQFARHLAAVCNGVLTKPVEEKGEEKREGSSSASSAKASAAGTSATVAAPKQKEPTEKEVWKDLMVMLSNDDHNTSKLGRRLTTSQINEILFMDEKQLRNLVVAGILKKEFVDSLRGNPLIVEIAKIAPADLLLLILQRANENDELNYGKYVHRRDAIKTAIKGRTDDYMTAAQKAECLKQFDGWFVRNWKEYPYENIGFILIAIALPLMAMFFPPSWLAIAGLGFIASLSIFTQWVGGIIIAGLVTKFPVTELVGKALVAIPGFALSAVLWLGGMLIKVVGLIGMSLGWIAGEIDQWLNGEAKAPLLPKSSTADSAGDIELTSVEEIYNKPSKTKDQFIKGEKEGVLRWLGNGIMRVFLLTPAKFFRDFIFDLGEGLRQIGKGLFMTLNEHLNPWYPTEAERIHDRLSFVVPEATENSKQKEPEFVPNKLPREVIQERHKEEADSRTEMGDRWVVSSAKRNTPFSKDVQDFHDDCVFKCKNTFWRGNSADAEAVRAENTASTMPSL